MTDEFMNDFYKYIGLIELDHDPKSPNRLSDWMPVGVMKADYHFLADFETASELQKTRIVLILYRYLRSIRDADIVALHHISTHDPKRVLTAQLKTLNKLLELDPEDQYYLDKRETIEKALNPKVRYKPQYIGAKPLYSHNGKYGFEQGFYQPKPYTKEDLKKALTYVLKDWKIKGKSDKIDQLIYNL